MLHSFDIKMLCDKTLIQFYHLYINLVILVTNEKFDST